MAQVPWFTADDGSTSRCFDLSRNKYFRTLETPAGAITRARGTASGFLKAVLSTTMPSLPLDVVITYSDIDDGLYVWNEQRATCMWRDSPYTSQETNDAICHSERVKVLREMHEVRKFRLVLCADAPGYRAEHVTRALKRIVEGEKARGGFDYLECEPSIILR